MEKFKYGIVVLHPTRIDDDGNHLVVHFAGYWKKPTKADFKHIKDELTNNPEFEFTDIIDELEYLPATKEYIDFFNDICEEAGIFNITKIEKERLN